MKNTLFLVLFIFFAVSCDKIEDLLPNGLTEAETIEGLKSALTIGTDTAVFQTHRVDGFYHDAAIKILMPPDASVIAENISYVPGGAALLEEVVLLMNRAAEDAAGSAVPVFRSAITGMTVSDAYGILTGNDTAATHYLREKTYGSLKTAFMPIVTSSLNKELIPGVSPNEAWNDLITEYNAVANSLVGQLAGLTPVNTQLDTWVTQQALNGLFMKISDEERAIRNDPVARVNAILRKVFGS